MTNIESKYHEESQTRPVALFKFAEAKWIKDIWDKETLRFSPIRIWHQIENDVARKDTWEGATEIIQKRYVKSINIKFNHFDSSKWYGHKPTGPVLIADKNRAKYPATHAFCFAMLTREMLCGKSSIDLSRFGSQFGESMLVVKKFDQFLSMIKVSIEKMGFENFNFGPVQYVSEFHHGEYSIFSKRNCYSWQREFRLAVECPETLTDEYISINVPKLKETCKFIIEPKLKFLIDNDAGTLDIR